MMAGSNGSDDNLGRRLTGFMAVGFGFLLEAADADAVGQVSQQPVGGAAVCICEELTRSSAVGLAPAGSQPQTE